MSYGDLTGITDGLEAQAAYIALLNPMVASDEKAIRRVELLVYCGTDTKELIRFCDVLEAA